MIVALCLAAAALLGAGTAAVILIRQRHARRSVSRRYGPVSPSRPRRVSGPTDHPVRNIGTLTPRMTSGPHRRPHVGYTPPSYPALPSTPGHGGGTQNTAPPTRRAGARRPSAGGGAANTRYPACPICGKSNRSPQDRTIVRGRNAAGEPSGFRCRSCGADFGGPRRVG